MFCLPLLVLRLRTPRRLSRSLPVCLSPPSVAHISKTHQQLSPLTLGPSRFLSPGTPPPRLPSFFLSSVLPLICSPTKYLESKKPTSRAWFPSFLSPHSSYSSPSPLFLHKSAGPSFQPFLTALSLWLSLCLCFLSVVSSQLIEQGMLCSLSSEGIQGEVRGGDWLY